jgi:hypothetical protein
MIHHFENRESGQNYRRGTDRVAFLKEWIEKDAAVVYLIRGIT